ncbi:MAG: VWA domain-containing protein [Chitinivibrionales bacterium]|nr:VWA domain-containing protein [Chitinivibrionales bacterium]
MNSFLLKAVITGIVLFSNGINAQDSICTYLWNACDVDTCINKSNIIQESGSGVPIKVPQNATKIAKDGLNLCLDVIELDQPLDVVFVVDLSGSMTPNRATQSGVLCSGNSNTTSSNFTVDPYQYSTLEVPITTSNCDWAGDPYGQRAIALRAGIDRFYQSGAATQSTAGYIGFNSNDNNGLPPGHQFQPVKLTSANRAHFDVAVDTLERYVRNRGGGGTWMLEALEQAKSWFDDNSLTPNNRQAIIFISDGEATGGHGPDPMFNELRNDSIPVYGIFLGIPETNNDLRNLSQSTNGEFAFISPDSTQKLSALVDDIIGNISKGFVARTISAKNTTTGQSPAQSVDITPSASGEIFNVVLDSTIALQPGQNRITIAATFRSPLGPGDTTFQFSFIIDATGSSQQCDSLVSCVPASKLEILNRSGLAVDSLTQNENRYMVRLTTYDTSLVVAYVDVTTAQKGDSETNLQLSTRRFATDNSGNVYAVLEGVFFFSASNTGSATPDNFTTESNLTDVITAVWTHPRDSRDDATAAMDVKSLPNSIEIYDGTGDPSGVAKYADYPSVVTAKAGENLPLVAKVFADQTWFGSYENAPLNENIDWRFIDVATGNVNDDAIGDLTATSGHDISFYPKRARESVDIVVTLTSGGVSELHDTIRVDIIPGDPHHLMIEATSDSSRINLYDDDPLALVEIDPNSTSQTVYAVLRDKEGNFISASNPNDWGSTAASVATVAAGNQTIGEGTISKGVDDSGSTQVWAQNQTLDFTDTVDVVVRLYTIDSLRIVANPSSTSEMNSLTVTTNDDTTIYVQGKRSDNGQWITVVADWSLNPVVSTDPPPGRGNSWKFSPNDTGGGHIVVSRTGAASDSMPFTFNPGFPTQVDMRIITPGLDSIYAGDTITAVVTIRNKNGVMPGQYCYPDQTNQQAIYQEVLGQGVANKRPLAIVNGQTKDLNRHSSETIKHDQCFTNGVDTVQFVLYYASPNDNTLNRLHVRLPNDNSATLEASTAQFKVLPGEADSIVLVDAGGNPPSGTIIMPPSPDALLSSELFDRYGNPVTCQTGLTIWQATGSLPAVFDSTTCEIFYRKPANLTDTLTGDLVVKIEARPNRRDSVAVQLIPPQAQILSMVTRDISGNGYLDRIEVTYDKAVSLADDYKPADNIAITAKPLGRTSYDFVADSVSLSVQNRKLTIYLQENKTEKPQTDWLPELSITGIIGAGDGGGRARDGAGPVIWSAVAVKRTATGPDERVYYEITATISEKLEERLSSRHEPKLVYYLYRKDGDGWDTLTNYLDGDDVIFLSSNDDQIARFQIDNGNEVTPNEWINFRTDVSPMHVKDRVNLPPNDNNHKVRIVVVIPESIAEAGPSPFAPTSRFHEIELSSLPPLEAARRARDFNGTALVVRLDSLDAPPSTEKITGRMRVFDIAGNIVAQRHTDDDLLLDEFKNKETSVVQLGFYWNGLNDSKMKAAPGIYLITLDLDIDKGSDNKLVSFRKEVGVMR